MSLNPFQCPPHHTEYISRQLVFILGKISFIPSRPDKDKQWIDSISGTKIHLYLHPHIHICPKKQKKQKKKNHGTGDNHIIFANIGKYHRIMFYMANITQS